jgi:hypothetical protein
MYFNYNIREKIYVYSRGPSQTSIVFPSGASRFLNGVLVSSNITINSPGPAGIEFTNLGQLSWVTSAIYGNWYNGTSFIVPFTNYLTNNYDTNIITPANGDILSYNSTSTKWENINPSRCLPTAEIYQNGDGATDTETLTTRNTWYIFNSATTFYANPSGTAVFNSPSNGAIKYTGVSAKFFHCAVSLSISTSTSANSYEVALFRNGVIESGTIFSIDFANNNVTTSTAFHKVLSLNNNDTIELKMRNISGAGAIITYNNINVVFMACCS